MFPGRITSLWMFIRRLPIYDLRRPSDSTHPLGSNQSYRKGTHMGDPLGSLQSEAPHSVAPKYPFDSYLFVCPGTAGISDSVVVVGVS